MPWYALYTKPRNEKKVEQELSAKGYDVYLPLVSTIKQWSDRKKKVQLPLFNSYLFINTTYEKYHPDILSVFGVVKFVRIGKDLASIRDEQIQNIKTFLSHDAAIQVVNQTQFELGDTVKITHGPFLGMKGKLAAYRQSTFFAIEIEQLGANLLLTIPVNYLEKY